MNVMSTNYSQKLRAIRKIEGFTQRKFAEVTKISLSTIRHYEAGQKPARTEVVEKVIQTKMFEKYSMWLMINKIAPESGQISPDFLEKKGSKTEEILIHKLSQQDHIQTINNFLQNIDDDQLKNLVRVFSLKGSLFLLELLDPENQHLLSLTGIKKQAAYQLRSMDDEKVREILAAMDKASLESRKIKKVKNLRANVAC